MNSPEQVGAARRALSAIFLSNGLGIGLWAVHIPLVQQRLALDARSLGWVLLTIAAAAMIAMPLSGAAAVRLGSRRITAALAIAFAFAIPLPIVAPSTVTLYIAALVFGACNGALDVSMNAHASEVEAARGQPTMSSFHGFFSLGGLVGAGLGGSAIHFDLGGGSGATIVAASSAAMLIFAIKHLLPTSAEHHESAHFGWPRKPALLLGLLALLCMAVEAAVADWSALLLTTNSNASAATAAWGYAAFSITMALCRFAGDGIVRRIGRSRLVLAGGLSITAGLSLAVIAQTPAFAAMGFALVGLGAANVIPVIFAAAARVPGVAAGAGVATAATIGYAGFLLGPPVIGWIASSIGIAGALGILSIAGIWIAFGADLAEPGPRNHSASIPAPRMRMAHMAMWVPVLDAAADFWREYFAASIGPPYASKRRPGFTSRFVTLPGDGGSIELMSAPWVEQQPVKDRLGWAHVAISVGSTAAVDALAKKFNAAGLLVEQPRVTGDGFYEAVVCMPAGILIELTA